MTAPPGKLWQNLETIMKKEVKRKLSAIQWNNRLSQTEYTQRRITYAGKYLGVMIKDLPIHYLKWGILNLGQSFWAECFARELQRRDRSFK